MGRWVSSYLMISCGIEQLNNQEYDEDETSNYDIAEELVDNTDLAYFFKYGGDDELENGRFGYFVKDEEIADYKNLSATIEKYITRLKEHCTGEISVEVLGSYG